MGRDFVPHGVSLLSAAAQLHSSRAHFLGARLQPGLASLRKAPVGCLLLNFDPSAFSACSFSSFTLQPLKGLQSPSQNPYHYPQRRKTAWLLKTTHQPRASWPCLQS